MRIVCSASAGSELCSANQLSGGDVEYFGEFQDRVEADAELTVASWIHGAWYRLEEMPP